MADAIQVQGLGKRYRLGTDRAGYDTLREAIGRSFRRPARHRSGPLGLARRQLLGLRRERRSGSSGRTGRARPPC